MEQKKLKNNYINLFLKKGKKNKFKIMYNKLLYNIKKKFHQKPEQVFTQAVNNLLPKIDKKKYKKKEFLTPIKLNKQVNKSIFWLISSSNNELEIFNTFNRKKSKCLKNLKTNYKNIDKLKFNK